MITSLIKKLFHSAGLEIHRYYPEKTPKLLELFNNYQVDMIFDIGANEGQSVNYFRALGYRGSIVAYEPVTDVFAKLVNQVSKYENVLAVNKALGAQPGFQKIQVSGGSAVASSLLKMTQNVYDHAPEQRVVREEDVEVATLAEEIQQHYPQGKRCFLKLDVQGYENKVLEGAGDSLSRVIGMLIEMSLVPNYESETLLHEMLPKLYHLGYRLADIKPGWSNTATGEIYQVDGLFFRTDLFHQGQ